MISMISEDDEPGELIGTFVNTMIGCVIAEKVIMEVFAEMSDEELDKWDEIFGLWGGKVDRERIAEYRKRMLKK
mgnify:CR=1 FL=1